MGNPWIMKMEQFTLLSDEDKRLLNELTLKERRHYGAREDIIREGEHLPNCHLMLSGLACHYKILEDGSRQIMEVLRDAGTIRCVLEFQASSTPCFSLVRNFSNESSGLSASSLSTVMPHLLRTASSTGLGLIMKTKD